MYTFADSMRDMAKQDMPGLCRLGVFGKAVKQEVIREEAEKVALQDRLTRSRDYTWKGEHWENDSSCFHYSVGSDEPNKKTYRHVLVGEAREIISGERERPEWMTDGMLQGTKDFLAQDGIEEFLHDGKGTVMDQTRSYERRTAPVSHLEIQQ